ncbi:heavy metal translocatin [Trametopsis cervina]|nr:heavy metal translocatin [Trametopsis cervina]
MSPSCCGGSTLDDTANNTSDSHGDPIAGDLTAGHSAPGSCCSGADCGCDDDCLDALARVICAEDDDHIHHGADGANAVTSEEICQCDNAAEEMSQKENTVLSMDMEKSKVLPEASDLHSCGLRKRNLTRPRIAAKACGEHVSKARIRQRDTLAAFGCICRALLAKGLQSCCTTRPQHTNTSTHVLPSLPKNTKSRTSFHSGCSGGCCGDDISSIKSADSCCSGGSCCKERPSSIKSVRRRASSVDSCGGKSCCAPSLGSTPDLEKEAIIEKCSDGARAVLSVKGMTCTGCENKLIKALRAQPAFINIKTSLVLSRAEFDYTCDVQDLPALVHILQKRTGFTIEQIASSSTARALELNTALGKKLLLADTPEGVLEVKKAGKDTVCVIYDPKRIGAREILDFYAPFTPTLASMPEDPALAAGRKHIRILLLRTIVSALLTIPVLIMTWAPLPDHAHAYAISSLILATIVQFAIAGPFYIAAFKSLLSGLIETELLIVLSTTTAYTYSVVAFAYQMAGKPLQGGSFFETSTLLVTLILFGQLASAFARHRAVAAISLRSLQQPAATLIKIHPDGHEEDVVLDARLLQYGDIFRVPSDSIIITDGLVIAGTSSVDESMMTGESLPVAKFIGSEVLAGTTNGSGTLLVKATRLPGENTISDIADMVDKARFSRAHIQGIVDRVCTWFVPAVIAVAVITFVAWLVIGIQVRGQSHGDAAVRALTYAVAVLAISCPCAIGLAVPMVVLVASGVAANLGIVFREANTIEESRKTTHAVFDKTGTLTMGHLQVLRSQIMLDAVKVDDAELSTTSLVLALVSGSNHPVARAISTYLAEAGTSLVPLVDIEEITGKGIQGMLSGLPLQGGNAAWLNIEKDTIVTSVLMAGHTAFCVTYRGALLAVFSLSDTIRPEARAVISYLRKKNIQVAILSGDHAAAVQSVASALDIPSESYRAGCLPSDKADFISAIQARGGKVMFCGDGTNDAVALAQADIGVHMSSEASSTGSAAAASAASDAVLMRPSLVGVLSLIELSDAVHRRIIINFVWAAIYNTVAILFAAGAFVNARIAPAYAGLGELVSVLPVVLIAMQLKLFNTKQTV